MTDDYSAQFLLVARASGAASAAPDAATWRSRDVGAGWRLWHHASLPVVEASTRDGAALGLFLGWPLGAAGGGRAPRCTAPFSEAAAGDAVLERFLYEHGGRWIFARAGAAGISRVYLDPFGSLALVYDRAEPRLASTTTLLGSRAGFARGRQASGDAHFPRPNQFFPPALTGDAGIARLLPNHCLDVERRVALRHWPAGPIARASEPAEVRARVEGIAEALGASLAALAADTEPYLSLTAGRDSRMLLACGREVRERLGVFTFDEPRETGPVDVELARRLARRHGLRHQVVPIDAVSAATEREYLERIGYAGHPGKARDLLQAARRHLDTARPWLAGFGGEVGRAFYWRRGDAGGAPLSPSELLERLGLPASPEFAACGAEWLAGLPTRDRLEQLDLAYLELRLGGWAGPHLYGAAFGQTLLPLAQRRVVEAMLGLPPAYRREQRLAPDVIRTAWPALLELPFQRMPGARGLWRWLRERQLYPRVRRLRQRLGGRSAQ